MNKKNQLNFVILMMMMMMMIAVNFYFLNIVFIIGLQSVCLFACVCVFFLVLIHSFIDNDDIEIDHVW